MSKIVEHKEPNDEKWTIRKVYTPLSYMKDYKTLSLSESHIMATLEVDKTFTGHKGNAKLRSEAYTVTLLEGMNSSNRVELRVTGPESMDILSVFFAKAAKYMREQGVISTDSIENKISNMDEAVKVDHLT